MPYFVFLDILVISLVFQVEETLVKVRNANNEQELGIHFKALKPEVNKLNLMAAKRQQVSTINLSVKNNYFQDNRSGIREHFSHSAQITAMVNMLYQSCLEIAEVWL